MPARQICSMNYAVELNYLEQLLWLARPDPTRWSGDAAAALTRELDRVMAELLALRGG